MKLKDQVCSLVYSIRLKDLGVKQDSLFYWRDNDGFDNSHETDFSIVSYINPTITTWYACAYTAAELGEILPDRLCINGDHPNLFIAKGTQEESKWTVGYSTMSNSITPFYTEFNEADIRAQLLIYVLENKLIELPI